MLCLSVIAVSAKNPIVDIICVVGLSIIAVGLTLRFFILKAQRFFLLPKRIVEIMATIVFTGIVSSVAVLYFPRGSYEGLLGLGVAIVWGFGGAAWAWSRTNTLRVSEENTRLYFLAASWAGVVGAVGLLVFVVSLARIVDALQHGRDFTPSEQRSVIELINYSALVMPLLLPYIVVDYRARKK